jgi:OmpA-OmpF porin, OOP family
MTSLSLASRIACAAAVTVLGALAGCGGRTSTTAARPAAQESVAPSPTMPKRCTQAGPVVFAVSGRANSPSPGLTTSMQAAATQAVDEGSSIGTVDVDGAPALSEAGSFNAAGFNRLALASAQQGYLNSLAAAVEHTRATSRDVNDLNALEVAGRALHAACSHGGTVYLEDSGLQETAPVNFTQPGMLGAVPAELVKFLASEHELPNLTGLAVVLVGIGDTAPPQTPLTIGQSANLVAIWTAIARAGGATLVTVDPSPRIGIPAPPSVPYVQLVQVPALPPWASTDRRYVFPDSGSVGFLPNLAQFRDPTAAERTLQPLAAYLKANPSARIKLTGTTAHFGSLGSCIALSLRRAGVVRLVLLANGAQASQIVIAGVGWEFSGYENDQGPDGSLLPAQAEQNRSVIVTSL